MSGSPGALYVCELSPSARPAQTGATSSERRAGRSNAVRTAASKRSRSLGGTPGRHGARVASMAKERSWKHASSGSASRASCDNYCKMGLYSLYRASARRRSPARPMTRWSSRSWRSSCFRLLETLRDALAHARHAHAPLAAVRQRARRVDLDGLLLARRLRGGGRSGLGRRGRRGRV